MNKLQVPAPSLSYLTKAAADSPTHLVDRASSNRLIVLIPADSDYTDMTRRIWELANATNSTVQLLGMCKDIGQEASLRRQLVTMSALIQDANVSVQTRVEIGTSWVDVLRRHYQTGDMIVCTAGQHTGIRRKPLSQILEANFQAPLYVLSDLSTETDKSDRLTQVIAWLGFIGIVAGFFVLQARVVDVTQGGFQTVLLALLLVPEFWLIWIWNNLFG